MCLLSYWLYTVSDTVLSIEWTYIITIIWLIIFNNDDLTKEKNMKHHYTHILYLPFYTPTPRYSVTCAFSDLEGLLRAIKGPVGRRRRIVLGIELNTWPVGPAMSCHGTCYVMDENSIIVWCIYIFKKFKKTCVKHGTWRTWNDNKWYWYYHISYINLILLYI